MPLDEREHRGELCELVDHRGRCHRGDDDDELEALVGPASRIAGSLAAERVRDLFEKCTGTVEQDRMSRSLLGGREPGEELRLGLRPIPGTARSRPSAAAVRNSSTVRTPSEDVTAIIRLPRRRAAGRMR